MLSSVTKMAECSAHTVHVFTVFPGLADSLSRSLLDTKVVSARSHGFGYNDYRKKLIETSQKMN